MDNDDQYGANSNLEDQSQKLARDSPPLSKNNGTSHKNFTNMKTKH
jgi:hypothetical protein